MSASRRRFLAQTGVIVALLSGCTAFDSSTPRIAKLEVTLENRTENIQVFHFAVETAKGLRKWYSHEVAPRTSETVVRKLDENFEPVMMHGVVDNQTARGDLIGSDGAEPREICLRVTFRCSVGEDPTFLQNSDIRC